MLLIWTWHVVFIVERIYKHKKSLLINNNKNQKNVEKLTKKFHGTLLQLVMGIVIGLVMGTISWTWHIVVKEPIYIYNLLVNKKTEKH